MSKHQTCRECNCDFTGPDLNIGSNLCESCSQELHGECRKELAGANAEVDRLVKENERLQRGEYGGEVVATAGGAECTCPICHAGVNIAHDEACPFHAEYLSYLQAVAEAAAGET